MYLILCQVKIMTVKAIKPNRIPPFTVAEGIMRNALAAKYFG
jgi:hypothetical protein